MPLDIRQDQTTVRPLAVAPARRPRRPTEPGIKEATTKGKLVTADWVEAIGAWFGALATVGTLIALIVGLRQERTARREDIRQVLAQLEREKSARYAAYLRNAAE